MPYQWRNMGDLARDIGQKVGNVPAVRKTTSNHQRERFLDPRTGEPVYISDEEADDENGFPQIDRFTNGRRKNKTVTPMEHLRRELAVSKGMYSNAALESHIHNQLSYTYKDSTAEDINTREQQPSPEDFRRKQFQQRPDLTGTSSTTDSTSAQSLSMKSQNRAWKNAAMFSLLQKIEKEDAEAKESLTSEKTALQTADEGVSRIEETRQPPKNGVAKAVPEKALYIPPHKRDPQPTGTPQKRQTRSSSSSSNAGTHQFMIDPLVKPNSSESDMETWRRGLCKTFTDINANEDFLKKTTQEVLDSAKKQESPKAEAVVRPPRIRPPPEQPSQWMGPTISSGKTEQLANKALEMKRLKEQNKTKYTSYYGLSSQPPVARPQPDISVPTTATTTPSWGLSDFPALR